MKDSLSHKGLAFKSGPFNILLRSDNLNFIDTFSNLYEHIPILSKDIDQQIYHFQIDITAPNNLRKFIKPQLEFKIDHIRPFEPYPHNHGIPLFEWGLNWVIAMTAHQRLMLHSAVLERNNVGCIFPAMPGSGKSTLCAALSFNGWRLLSDEFGLIDHESHHIVPMPRTIGLKNESIDVVKDCIPDAVVGPSFYNTRKGTVAHVKPSKDSFNRQEETVEPKLIIFPKYTKENQNSLIKLEKSIAFTKLSNNSFNYQVSLRQGFKTLSYLIQNCECYTLEYNDFDKAIPMLKELVDGVKHG